MSEIKKILKVAEGAKKENKKYLDKIAQKKPKGLDDSVHQKHDEFFETFDCLTCANCCKTTSPLFLDKDVERLAKHFKIKPVEFTIKYLVIDEDGDKVLHSSPCPFLGKDNYCSVYEARPNACREYPHTDRKKFYQITKETYFNTLICPAVATIVEQLKKEF